MAPAEPRRGPQRRWPRALLVIAGALVGVRALLPEPRSQVSWVPLQDAARVSSETGRPVLYDFTAEWCGPCKQMDREVFADPRQAALINSRFVPVRVVDRAREDGANAPEVAALLARHKVRGFPTLVVVDGQGAVLRQLPGYLSRRSVVRFLKQGRGTP
jgi:thiol:disulfide interchange protein